MTAGEDSAAQKIEEYLYGVRDWVRRALRAEEAAPQDTSPADGVVSRGLVLPFVVDRNAQPQPPSQPDAPPPTSQLPAPSPPASATDQDTHPPQRRGLTREQTIFYYDVDQPEDADNVYLQAESNIADRRLQQAMNMLGLKDKLANTVEWTTSKSSSSQRNRNPLAVMSYNAEQDKIQAQMMAALLKSREESDKEAGGRTVSVDGVDYVVRPGTQDSEIKRLRDRGSLINAMTSAASELSKLNKALPTDRARYKKIVADLSARTSEALGQGAMTNDEQKKIDEILGTDFTSFVDASRVLNASAAGWKKDLVTDLRSVYGARIANLPSKR